MRESRRSAKRIRRHWAAAQVQLRILRGLSRGAPGGVLLYSTCTVLREENEGVVSAFLKEAPQFSAEEFRLPGVGRYRTDLSRCGRISTVQTAFLSAG